MTETLTERQAEAWPEAIAEAQRYVDSPISEDITHYYWTIHWCEETRPGRGHSIDASWCDGEHLVLISMDVYGSPAVSVAEVTWTHSSADEECACKHCKADREADDD